MISSRTSLKKSILRYACEVSDFAFKGILLQKYLQGVWIECFDGNAVMWVVYWIKLDLWCWQTSECYFSSNVLICWTFCLMDWKTSCQSAVSILRVLLSVSLNYICQIVFDECHKAKNVCPIGSSKPTKTGLAVLELQNKLPKARVVYASATGTEIKEYHTHILGHTHRLPQKWAYTHMHMFTLSQCSE